MPYEVVAFSDSGQLHGSIQLDPYIQQKSHLCICVKALKTHLYPNVNMTTVFEGLQICCEALVGFVVSAGPGYLLSKVSVHCLCCISVFWAGNFTCDANSYFMEFAIAQSLHHT